MSVKAFKDKHIAGVPVISSSNHLIGEICFSTVCPGNGWVECDGQNGTVDTRETRLFGTPDDASVGQRINDAVGRHNHNVTMYISRPANIYFSSGDVSVADLSFATTLDLTAHVDNVADAIAADFTRSNTYYLKMWMYIGGI